MRTPTQPDMNAAARGLRMFFTQDLLQVAS